jgi:hypothetical protein
VLAPTEWNFMEMDLMSRRCSSRVSAGAKRLGSRLRGSPLPALYVESCVTLKD